MLELAAGGEQDALEGGGLLADHIGAAQRALAACLGGDGVHRRLVLAAQDQGDGAVLARDGMGVGRGGLLGVRRADDVEVRDAPERGHRLHRLVGRAVLAHADRVVREDVEDLEARERGQADGGPQVVREGQERGPRTLEHAVVGDAVEDRAHGVLADAEVQVAARGRGHVEVPEVLEVVLGRAVQVGRARDDEGGGRGGGVEHELARGARRVLVAAHLGDGGEERLGRAVVAGQALGEQRGLVGVRLGPGREGGLPRGARLALGGLARGEIGARLRGDMEGRLGQAERLAGGRDELHAGLAVALAGAGDLRDALGDGGLADDEPGLAVARGAGGVERADDRRDVVAVAERDDLPVAGRVARGGVLVLRLRGHRVEGDVVRVVEHHEVVQPEASGQRGRLLRDALLQAAVAGEADDQVVEDGVLGGVEAGGRHLGGDGHADEVARALAERPGRGLDAGGLAELGVARGLAVQLAEGLHVIQRDVEAGQVEPAVGEHRAMAGREHEAVAVGPGGVGGVDAEEGAVERRADLGGAEGQAEVPGVAGGDGVHGETAGLVGGAGEGGYVGGGHEGSCVGGRGGGFQP